MVIKLYSEFVDYYYY